MASGELPNETRCGITPRTLISDGELNEALLGISGARRRALVWKIMDNLIHKRERICG